MSRYPLYAGGLNDLGQIVGTASFPENMYTGIPALYDHGTVTPLGFGQGPFDGVYYSVTGINNSGLVIGTASGGKFYQPFVYQNGMPVDIGLPSYTIDLIINSLNNKGEFVGVFNYGPYGGNLLNNGVITTIVTTGPPRYPGDTDNYVPTNPTGINDLGQIVGTYAPNGYASVTGFLLSGGVYSQIMVPGSSRTLPVAINNSGEVVGTFQDVAGTHGFEEEAGVFSTIVGPGGGDFLPVGLNNLGQIIGSPDQSGFIHSYLGTPQAVPEPSTLALLCAGMTGLFGWRVRARQGSIRR